MYVTVVIELSCFKLLGEYLNFFKCFYEYALYSVHGKTVKMIN